MYTTPNIFIRAFDMILMNTLDDFINKRYYVTLLPRLPRLLNF